MNLDVVGCGKQIPAEDNRAVLWRQMEGLLTISGASTFFHYASVTKYIKPKKREKRYTPK